MSERAERSSAFRRPLVRGLVGVMTAGMFAISGCFDDPVTAGGSSDAHLLASLPPGIHPILSIPDPTAVRGNGVREVRLYLWPQGIDDPVGAFQGEIRIAEDGVEILDAAFPEGVLGAWNVVEPGRLRFAGVVPEGLGSKVALLLRVRPRRVLRSETFQVTVERVAAAGTLSDLTGQVARRAHPPVVRGPLPSHGPLRSSGS